jgi:pimeloyl-ACP methyl ester carboxylesterase
MTATTTDSASNGKPTIVLVHGLWMTPRSWEKWIDRYSERGYRVLAPPYPGLEGEVEALNADPSPIEALTVPAVVESYERIIKALDRPPILIGHSFGGLIVQILLDHGLGAVGVAIDSGAPEGVRTLPLAQAKAGFPVLKNPANRHRAVGLTPKELKAFPDRAHYTLGQEGWEQVADYALSWATDHAQDEGARAASALGAEGQQ